MGADPVMPLTYLTGDATAPDIDGPKILAHIVNDVGYWAQGFVLEVSRRWPQVERHYRDQFVNRSSAGYGGHNLYVRVTDTLLVANMVAQHGIRTRENPVPLRYDWLETCLADLNLRAEHDGSTVHMPRIGSGLAGGDWSLIERIIDRTLPKRDVYVYERP